MGTRPFLHSVGMRGWQASLVTAFKDLKDSCSQHAVAYEHATFGMFGALWILIVLVDWCADSELVIACCTGTRSAKSSPASKQVAAHLGTHLLFVGVCAAAHSVTEASFGVEACALAYHAIAAWQVVSRTIGENIRMSRLDTTQLLVHTIFLVLFIFFATHSFVGITRPALIWCIQDERCSKQPMGMLTEHLSEWWYQQS